MQRHPAQRRFLLRAGCLLLVLVGCASEDPSSGMLSAESAAWFQPRSLDVNTWRTFDLGSVDVDGDGDLDLFTTNHHSQQSVLLNDGKGVFEPATSQLGLDFDLAFRGWERLAPGPCPDGGLSIYRKGDAFAVEFSPTAGVRAARGTFDFLTAVRAVDEEDVEVSVRGSDDGEATPHELTFSFRNEGRFTIRPEHLSLPLAVKLDPLLPLDGVFVGAECVSPVTSDFTLRLTDRHGMAWADYDGDGMLDLAVPAGGLRADIDLFSPHVTDELFRAEGGRLRDVTAGSGLAKNGCRGRQAAWVDVDENDRLDLTMTCYGGFLQVWLQADSGRFVLAGADMGLGNVRADTLAWFDLDGDMRPELIVETEQGLSVYKKANASFSLLQRLELPDTARRARRDERVRKLALADYDGDGDADLFLPSAGGSYLLTNDGGSLRRVDPRSAGLPRQAVMAQWVDYDNDGLLDLHAVPGGLYRQVNRTRFLETGILAELAGGGVDEVRTEWADYDGDGRRDLVVATADESKSDLRDFETRYLANTGPGGHWLQVDLVGGQGRHDAIGAMVRLRLTDRELTRWVGEADGSVFSQGHRRLYFGLGADTSVVSMHVTWPDGTIQPVPVSGVDQLLRVVQLQ